MTNIFFQAVVCFLAISVSFAASRSTEASPVVVVEPAVSLPSGWTVKGRATPHASLELTFAVRQQGLEELSKKLLQVSDPASPQYGQHLTNAEVQQLTRPADADLARVSTFLAHRGISFWSATPNSDFLNCAVTVAVAERLLSTTYVELQHKSGETVIRSLDGYSLPVEVAAVVDFVAPTTHVPGVHTLITDGPRSSVHTNESKFGFNTPKNLRQLYSVGEVEGKAPGNKQAVTAFLGQAYGEWALKLFWRTFCGGITCGKGAPKLIGDKTTGIPGVEAMLDIETITGVSGNVHSEFWGYSGNSPDNPKNEPYMKWLQQMSNTSDKDIPTVFSTSYGEDEGSWSFAAATRLNVEFQKAGVRGISLLFASGDSGPNCEQGKFVPQAPASSPWVTAVGGTAPGASWPNPPSASSTSPSEVAISLSSGGFSDRWPMPEWQKSQVVAYLNQSGLPDQTKAGYNISGRAFPDIAAQATDFFVYATLPTPGVAGTSCASPTAAGIFSLVNDLRLASGKSTLGFLNPLIYSHKDAFNDITHGSSKGSCGEWPSKPGWDAVTGMGTPNYAKLAEVATALPAGRYIPRGEEEPQDLSLLV